MADYAVGTHLYSQVCSTQVIVVRAPSGPVALACGGVELTTQADQGNTVAAELTGPGTQLGKRYATESGLELLCVKAGAGALSVDGAAIPIKSAKPLPASD
jgi:hypothetical protein